MSNMFRYSLGVASAALVMGSFAAPPAFAATVSSTTSTLAQEHPAMNQVLQYGSQNHWVATLQADLALLGYTGVGTDDGIFGLNTLNAVDAFQSANGFPVTGVTSAPVWQDILAELNLVPEYVPSDTSASQMATIDHLIAQHPAMSQWLQEGSTGHWVMTLQDDLALAGYPQVGPADGIFGPKTESAVEAFQQAARLPVTGVTTPLFWQALLAQFGLVPAPSTVSTQITPTPQPTGSTSQTGTNITNIPMLLHEQYNPTGQTPVVEPSLSSTTAATTGQVAPTVKTVDGKPVIAEYHMIATAYAPSLQDNYPYGAVDAFGQPLQWGMVAVDPSVIPLHSTLYIQGYQDNYLPSQGFVGQALDTGGAIRGDRIDIFMNESENVVSDFGVQPVTVYVLGR